MNPQEPMIYRRRRLHRPRWTLVVGIFLLVAAGWYFWYGNTVSPKNTPTAPGAKADSGRLLRVESAHTFTPTEAAAVAREIPGGGSLSVTTSVTRVIYQFRSYDIDGTPLSIYARAYIPAAPAGKLPIFAFATGTTGIGDQCAPSLEQPHKVDWANYEAHMMMYASQGYAAVVTDYEGHRDDTRLHHYMIGQLEGRAVLDSIRGMSRLQQAERRLDRNNIFLGGYSQGGHAVFWADKVQPTYAPELPAKGVVGFGPVMSVKDTLADVARGANINWFGPYVLTSYRDYYKENYSMSQILLPNRLTNLAADVQKHCIDSVIRFWPTMAGTYTPEFIQAMTTGDWQSFPELDAALALNLVGDQATGSAKRINQGRFDNVVLPRQQEAAMPLLCSRSRGPVQLQIYPTATHYNTMALSFKDTLAWMANLRSARPVPNTCSR